MTRDEAYLRSLVHELVALPAETGWLELKHNNADPQEIGEYISALANSGALEGKSKAYLLWGVDDATHAPIGTNFDPSAKRIGGEELESWLLRQLAPKIEFRFYRIVIDGLALVLLEIDRAFRHPVQFAGAEFVRVGSYKKRLKDFPEKERTLWRIFDATTARTRSAGSHTAPPFVFQTELQLPAPAFEVVGESTRGTLFTPRALTKIAKPLVADQKTNLNQRVRELARTCWVLDGEPFLSLLSPTNRRPHERLLPHPENLELLPHAARRRRGLWRLSGAAHLPAVPEARARVRAAAL